MISISVRGIDDQLALLLKRKAAKEKKSMNQFVLELLKRGVGLEKEQRFTNEYSDLDSLFGRWSEKEFNAIQKKINSESIIDQEIWS